MFKGQSRCFIVHQVAEVQAQPPSSHTDLCLGSVVTQGDDTFLGQEEQQLPGPHPSCLTSSGLPEALDASPQEPTAWGRGTTGSIPELCLLLHLEATASGSQHSFTLALGKEGGEQLNATGRCLDPCLGHPEVF